MREEKKVNQRVESLRTQEIGKEIIRAWNKQRGKQHKMLEEKEVMKNVLGPLKNDITSNLKTLKAIQEYANDHIDTITEEPCFFGFNDALDIFSEELIKEAKNWIKELNKTLEKACKKQEDGYYNDAELEIEGVMYTASAFADDEAEPIIKFINQFFNLEK